MMHHHRAMYAAKLLFVVASLSGCGANNSSQEPVQHPTGGSSGSSGSTSNPAVSGGAGGSNAGGGPTMVPSQSGGASAKGGASGQGGASARGGMSGTGGATTAAQGGADTGKPGLTLTPNAATLIFGAKQTFTCTVTGESDKTCLWSLTEGDAGGQLDASSGVYTAPATAGTYHLTATSKADATLKQSATIRVVAPSSPGEWINVTPTGISLDQNSNPNGNYGVQDVLADPAKPSDLYAFVCYQGVWRSQDYGQTWKKVSAAGSIVETGRPWGAGIEQSSSRDTSKAPILYTLNGVGTMGGVLRSTDWGVTWTHSSAPDSTGQDTYSIDVDPYDGNHLLVGFHEAEGLIESTDGAQTWKVVSLPKGSGVSSYPFFVRTGDAATTRKTWLIVAQSTGGMDGTWRTEDGGATWKQVDTFEHSHGASQVFQPAPGTLYVGADYGKEGNGIYRSQDFGKSWHLVSQLSETTVVGTPNYLYASKSQGWGPGYAGMARASAASGTDWTTTTDPNGMSDGAKRSAVTYDGKNYVIVSGAWRAGIWRYVEP